MNVKPPLELSPFRSQFKVQEKKKRSLDKKPQVIEPDSKTKSFSAPAPNQANSDPYTEIKSSSILLTEIESISTNTKTYQVVHFDPPHKNQVNFDPPRKSSQSRHY